jgi:hypothetical protein
MALFSWGIPLATGQLENQKSGGICFDDGRWLNLAVIVAVRNHRSLLSMP